MTDDSDTKEENRIVAVGLLTRREVSMVGAQLSRLYPLDGAGPFTELIEAIDEADRQFHQGSNARAC